MAPQFPARQALHAATGLAAVWVLLVPPPWRLAGLAAMLAGALLLDGVRARPAGRAWLDARLPGMYRAPETGTVSGPSLLAAGYLLAAWWFPPQAAAGGILAAALGDPTAALVGGWRGRRHAARNPEDGASVRLGARTWAGTFAFAAVALPALWLLPQVGLPAAALGAAIGALAERASGRLDNLVVPSAVALALWLWLRTG